MQTNDYPDVPESVLSLHDGPYKDWACDDPERPYSDDVGYDFRCRGCWLHAQAALAHGHNPVRSSVTTGLTKSMAEMVTAYAWKHTR